MKAAIAGCAKIGKLPNARPAATMRLRSIISDLLFRRDGAPGLVKFILGRAELPMNGSEGQHSWVAAIGENVLT
jgi:hypothetical protein